MREGLSSLIDFRSRLEFPYRRNAASTADHIRLELDRVMDMK